MTRVHTVLEPGCAVVDTSLRPCQSFNFVFLDLPFGVVVEIGTVFRRRQ